jgi:hypothetical protein
MNNLKESSKERLNASWLSHPVTGHAAIPGHFRDGRWNSTPFWLADGFLCDDSAPLPSMFRSNVRAGGSKPQSAYAGPAGPALPAAKPSKWPISKRTASYIMASFLLVFATVDGVLLTASTFSADRRALAGQAPAVLDQDGTETSMLFSAHASEAAEGSHAPSFAPAQGTLSDGEPWSATVGALEQLLARQKASQAAAMKEAENERLLKRLEAWMNARAPKPAVLAGGCTAPAGQCWKGAARIQ